MWGFGVHKLVQESKKEGINGSPVRKAVASKSAVFDYRAQDNLGAGAISVYLQGDSPTWGRESLTNMVSDLASGVSPIPDVLIALDAGLGSYISRIALASLSPLRNIYNSH